ncbi:hypothetical protein ACYZT2_20695 [Pseudomonas sp. MDT1-85]
MLILIKQIFVKNRASIEAVLGSIFLCGIGFVIQWRYGFGLADEGLLWYASQRTFLGEIPILDFYSYDPGRYYWASLFFHITGSNDLFSLLLAGAAFGSMGLTVVWYAMSKAGLPWKTRLACAVLLVIALGFPRHKVYEQSLTLILCALVFFTLVNFDKTRQWFIFGVFTGLAAFIGRNHGFYFLVAFFLIMLYMLYLNRRTLLLSATAWFTAGIFAGYSPMLMMLVFQQGFFSAFMDSLLAVSTWQLPIPIPFIWRADLSGEITVTLIQTAALGMTCILIPLIYAAGIYIFLSKSKRGIPNSLSLLIGASCAAGIPYLHQAFERADLSHIAQATLPAYIAAFGMSHYFSSKNKKALSVTLAYITSITMLTVWIPNEPGIIYLRQKSNDPDSVSAIDIGDKKFYIDKYQADVLFAVKRAMQQCNIGRNELLAAPHFPGVYAFFNAKAPSWELYYLYKRSDQFQRDHIKAISNTKLILLSPEATIDNLENLKLKNTYSLLVEYIHQKYKKIAVVGSPDKIQLLNYTEACSSE